MDVKTEIKKKIAEAKREKEAKDRSESPKRRGRPANVEKAVSEKIDEMISKLEREEKQKEAKEIEMMSAEDKPKRVGRPPKVKIDARQITPELVETVEDIGQNPLELQKEMNKELQHTAPVKRGKSEEVKLVEAEATLPSDMEHFFPEKSMSKTQAKKYERMKKQEEKLLAAKALKEAAERVKALKQEAHEERKRKAEERRNRQIVDIAASTVKGMKEAEVEVEKKLLQKEVSEPIEEIVKTAIAEAVESGKPFDKADITKKTLEKVEKTLEKQKATGKKFYALTRGKGDGKRAKPKIDAEKHLAALGVQPEQETLKGSGAKSAKEQAQLRGAGLQKDVATKKISPLVMKDLQRFGIY